MHSHRAEIERALSFVADRLDQPITVAEVARAAHLSEFQFHRVFHAEVGEPIGRFVTHRRLEAAALLLTHERDRSIADIALASGYSSASNFAKAFQIYLGSSPSDVREGRDPSGSIGKLTAQYGKQPRPGDLYVAPPALGDAERRARAAECVVRIETSKGKDFACVSGPGGYGLAELEPLWQDLTARCQQLGMCGDAVDAWGIPFDSPAMTAPELCRYHACLPCAPEQSLAPPLFRGRMPEGRFAVFTYDGPIEGVDASYRTIFSCWFPSSALAPEDLTPFQRYIGDAPKDGRVKLETWLKVQPRTA